ETKSGVKLEEFKHGQDQSAKIWLALVSVLAGLYFGKDLVRDEPTPPPTPVSTPAPPHPLKPVPTSKPSDSDPHQYSRLNSIWSPGTRTFWGRLNPTTTRKSQFAMLWVKLLNMHIRRHVKSCWDGARHSRARAAASSVFCGHLG